MKISLNINFEQNGQTRYENNNTATHKTVVPFYVTLKVSKRSTWRSFEFFMWDQHQRHLMQSSMKRYLHLFRIIGIL